MMQRFYIVAFLIALSQTLFSQEVVLDMDTEEQYTGNKGPNMRHYGYLYLGVGNIPGFEEQTGSKIDFTTSGEFQFGYRYKLKVLSFYSLGFDLNFQSSRYGLEGDKGNPVDPANPLTLTSGEKRHALRMNSAGAGVYQRINIGKRGNSLGNYLDMGIEGRWILGTKEVLVFKNSTYLPASRSRYTYRGLDFTEQFYYGLNIRAGTGRYMIYADYRLSDYFTSAYSIPELPRLNTGIQIVLK